MKLQCMSLFAVLLLSGCASGSAVVTGGKRPPVPTEAVKLYLSPPANYEVIGLVEATGMGWTSQGRMDNAIDKLKEKAGKIGANGVLIATAGEASGGVAGVVNNGVFVGGNQRLKHASGQAIYVTP